MSLCPTLSSVPSVLSQSKYFLGGATPTMDESEPVVASTGNIAIVEVNSGVPITKTRVETSSSSSSSSSSSDSSDSSSDDDRRRKPKMRPSRSMMDKMDRRRYQRFLFRHFVLILKPKFRNPRFRSPSPAPRDSPVYEPYNRSPKAKSKKSRSSSSSSRKRLSFCSLKLF